MQWAPSRRRMLVTLSSATAASLIGGAHPMAQEAPPETTTIRLTKIPGICVAPQYVAEELLKAEGFTDIKYVEMEAADVHAAFAAAKVDVSMAYVAPFMVLPSTAKLPPWTIAPCTAKPLEDVQPVSPASKSLVKNGGTALGVVADAGEE